MIIIVIAMNNTNGYLAVHVGLPTHHSGSCKNVNYVTSVCNETNEYKNNQWFLVYSIFVTQNTYSGPNMRC